MINKLNKIAKELLSIRLVWPADKKSSHEKLDKLTRTRRFERIVGLVPQEVCLFKLLEYEIGLVSRSHIDECVKNELSSLSSWPNTEHYYLVSKGNDKWRVAVWFWNREDINFHVNVTHKIPAIAYYGSALTTSPALLCYEEKGRLYGCHIAKRGEVHEFYPLDTPLYQRWFEDLVSKGYPLLTNNSGVHYDGQLLNKINKIAPPQNVFQAGKVSSFFDLSSPWDFHREILYIFLAGLIFIGSDFALLQIKSSRLDGQYSELVANTADLVNLRTNMAERSKILEKMLVITKEQRTVVDLLELLIKQLPEDVILTEFSYEERRAIIQGVVRDSVKLMDTLGAQKEVERVRLLGDVTPRDDGSQLFKAEILLVK